MKSRFLPFGILLAVAGVAVTFFNASESTYVSVENRSLTDENSEKGYKGAYEHMMRLNADPTTGTISTEDVLRAREEVMAYKKARSSAAGLDLQWQEMGPDNAGGRTRAILIDKDNHDKMFAGGVTGGLWKSMDGGNNWSIVPGSDEFDNIGIVSMTQAVNGDIYFGTGESTFSNVWGGANGGSGSIGGGIWKSTDGGATFEHLSSTAVAANDLSDGWASVAEMASDPSDANRIYACTGGGMKVSSDGGLTWENGPLGSFTFMDVEVASDGSVYASTANKIYYSANGDVDTYEMLPTGVTFGGGSGRIEVAIAPSDPNYVYAVFSNQGGLGKFKGFYRSTDKGQTWEELLPGWIGTTPPVYNIFNQQANYDMALAVDPNDKDHAIIGGLDIWEWSLTTGIEKKSYWAMWEASSFFVHADQHEIVYHPSIPGKLFIGNDGGVFGSEDNTQTFSGLNRGYGVTQFYAIGFSKEGHVIGGTQDNGTQLINFSVPASDLSSVEVRGGDGGFSEISYIDSDVMFAESQNGHAGRSADGGNSFSGLETFLGDEMAGWNETAGDMDADSWFAAFINPFLLWESVDVNGAPVDTSFFFASTAQITATSSDFCIWMTKEALDFSIVPTWFQISTTLPGSAQCMAVTNDGNSLFVGVDNKLFRIDNLNVDSLPSDSVYLDVEGSESIVATSLIRTFSGTVTGIATDPNNTNRAVVTLGNFSNGDHVYESTDALAVAPNFSVIQGNLPKMPVYSAVIDVTNSDNILVGTEFGVWSSSNGSTWTQEDNGMPNVPCYMLRQQTLPGINKGVVYVGSHGRGIFKSSTLIGLEEVVATTTELEELMIYPNPASSYIHIETGWNQEFTIEVYDMMGRTVHSETQSKTDLDVSSLDLGNYIVVVKGVEGEKVGQFVKTK